MRKIATVMIAFVCLLGACSSNDTSKETKDIISNITWYASDGSAMVLKDDTFAWYLDEDVQDDNVYKGTYDVYYGDDAIKYITTDLKDYGITEDELEDQFNRNDNQSKENLCVFVLHNTSAIVDGEETEFDPYDTPYFGFYYEDDDRTTLDLANMNTGNYATFKNVKE